MTVEISLTSKQRNNKSKEMTAIMQHFWYYVNAGPRNTMNTITSTLDANFIYGASKETAGKLRLFRGGLLKSNAEHRHLGLKDLLPPKLESPDAGCVRPNNDSYCFLAGKSYFKKTIGLKKGKLTDLEANEMWNARNALIGNLCRAMT